MKRFLFIIMLCMTGVAFAQPNEKPFTVPEITSWKGGTGSTQLSGRVIVKSASLKPVAEALARDYSLLTGKPMTTASGKARTGDIVLTLKKLDTMPAEGYRIRIGDIISVEAPAQKGAFWATRTLLQMVESAAAPLTLSRGEITDIPQYRMRGFMLDVGRKYIPIFYLRELVKVMAYYKMNTLQIHLNDNSFPKYFETKSIWSTTCGLIL